MLSHTHTYAHREAFHTQTHGVPVNASLLQVGFVVAFDAALSHQFVWVWLVGHVLGYQGDSHMYQATVVMDL